MAQNNSLDALFAKGLTINQFLDKYEEMKEDENNKKSYSIFNAGNETSMSDIYRAIDTDGNDELSEKELADFRAYDKTDGEDVLSEADLKVLYNKTFEKIKEQQSGETAEENYEKNINSDELKGEQKEDENINDTYLRVVSGQIESLKSLMALRESDANLKIQGYQNQLDNIMVMESDFNEDQKKNYTTNAAKMKALKTEIEQKQKEIDEAEREMKLAKAEIEYIEQHRKEDDQSANKKIEQQRDIYDSYSSKYETLTNEIKTANMKLSDIAQKQDKLASEAKGKKSDFDQKKKNLQNLIDEEKAAYERDMNNYQSQMTKLEASQQYALTKASGESLGDYEFDGNISYDAQELKSKWSKSKPHLSDAFYQKVCEISQRLKCDPNALMAVMNSESGLNAAAVNKNGGATGLIQFMPSTAKAYGTTTAALRNMSAVQQLDYVEKFFKGKTPANGTLDAGTLYALVFLPARAKNNVLTTKGEKFYNANVGLDINKDGQITKADLAARVAKFMPK